MDIGSPAGDTIPLARVQPADHDAIIFADGRGTIWNFPTSADVPRLTSGIYEQGGVRDGLPRSYGLVNMRLANDEHLTNGKCVAGFTNAEEEG